MCYSKGPENTRNYEPVSKGEVIKHSYYTLSYSEDNEQASWVYYILTPDLINGTQSRTDDFRADPAVSTGSASLNAYKGSGYDRGHLCPAADMTINKTAMSETFYLSNMSPQVAGFNRGIWSTLESQVREWAITYSKLYVVTGAIFKDNIGVIGENKVTVPGYYYKVLYDGNSQMVGLILPNASSSKSLDQFVVTVDQIEAQTGIDFFPGLDDKLETQIEGSINITGWSF
ncbi:MAG: DNA/RNA non-specific endonuclease [Prolixibacteraceae bacterium]|nr:DNA/RNA non-specific endonuclease [Prolixibacteraceae bacterium]